MRWHPVFFGVDVPDAEPAAVTAFAAAVGSRPTVSSMFIRYDATWTAKVVRQMAAARLTPFVTLEPWHRGAVGKRLDPADSLAALLAGRFDAELRMQARALATSRGPIYLRFAHEMNGDWYPWAVGVNGNTAAQYVAAWRHVHALFEQQVPQLKVRWVFAPAALGSERSADDVGALYPGDDVVDVLGLTGYEHGGSQPQETFGPTVEALSRLGPQPLVLAEIGVDGAGKAAWLRNLGPYLRQTTRVSGFVYFNTTPQTTGATGHYALGSGDVPAFRTTLEQLAAPPR
ncbi:glycosyl hydrolase [Dermatophilaceae bacterium Soc4.6]